ncbi:MAG: HypC/HybG/HupF family hydrogenase formation chaperone [Clostridiales bacterium]|nr:HypC/HybG/HupF family hydrogenase formation chaperone [Clostridiales bacterium]MDO5140643.1 HypC/HybG/HupF family hydrogenase formation chaperone [Eubacteriales bacterium]
MCLAVPLTIKEIKPGAKEAVAERDGVVRVIDISFLREPRVGDSVLVHAGFAIERLRTQQAEDIMDSYNELMEELRSLGGQP